MRVRHLVARANVADGLIVDAAAARHGLVVGRRVAALAGPIDPLTHLNLDFAAHRLEGAIVVAALEVGAEVALSGDRFEVAWPARSAFGRLGPVDVGARRGAWLAHRLAPRMTVRRGAFSA
ncbi:MAG TPA: hypothetical protein VGL23_02190 [Chloroflexota bacterium]